MNDSENFQIIKGQIKRAAMFVDVQNVWKTFGKIDYALLLKYAAKGRDLVRAAAFMSYDPNDEGQHNFMRALSHLGYRVVSKAIKRFPDGTIKGNMDLEIAIDALTLGKTLDEVILVTGDGDFVKLVEALGYMGVRVEVIGPDTYTASQLIYAADRYVNLSSLEETADSSRKKPPHYHQNHSPASTLEKH